MQLKIKSAFLAATSHHWLIDVIADQIFLTCGVGKLLLPCPRMCVALKFKCIASILFPSDSEQPFLLNFNLLSSVQPCSVEVFQDPICVPFIASLKSLIKCLSGESSLDSCARVLPSGDIIFNQPTLRRLIQAALCLSLPFYFSNLWPDAFLNLDMPIYCNSPSTIMHPITETSELFLTSHVLSSQKASWMLVGVPGPPHSDTVGSSADSSARASSALSQGTWSHWKYLNNFF